MSNDFFESFSFRTMICDSCQAIIADATFNGQELSVGDCLSAAYQLAKNGDLNEAIKFGQVALITLHDKSNCISCTEKISKFLDDGSLADIYLGKFQ